jgi:glycosyltransferase involved in cell wall biosynthesis
MKIACVCVTYLRAHLLGRVIRCFLRQTHEDRELIILDDAGEYASQEGDRWRLISIDQRFRSLGEKRNAATALVSADVDAVHLWDDDDLYMPWALEAAAEALEHAAVSRPSQVLNATTPDMRTLQRHYTGGLYHGGWAYRLDAFHALGGYRNYDNGEDQELLARFPQFGISTADPIEHGFDPAYIYTSEQNNSYRMSHCGPDGWRELGKRKHDGVKAIVPGIEEPLGIETATISENVLPRTW